MRGLALISVVVSAAMLFTPYYYLAPFPAVSLLALLWLYRNPALGFYLIIFLIPFASFRKIGPVNIPWVLSIAVLAIFALKFVKDKRLPAISHSNLWPIIILYVIANLLSVLFSEYPDTAQKNMVLLVAGYSFVFMGMVCLTQSSFRSHIPNVVIGSVGLSAVLAFLDSFLGWSLFSEVHLSGQLVRSIGGSLDPNNFSIMILFTLPIVIHRTFYARSTAERTLMVLIIPIMLITVTSTFSRSGFLAMVVCLVLIMLHYRQYLRPRILGFLLLFGFMGFILTMITVPASFWDRQLSLLNWEDGSLNRRASYLAVGSDAIARYPLLGSGPGTFNEIYAKSEVSRQFTRREADRARRAHNTYLEVLTGTGLVGFVLFIALNIRALKNYLSAERAFLARGDPELANLTASWRIGFLTLMLFLLTFSELYHKYMLLSLAISQGAIYFAQRETDSETNDLADMPKITSTV